MPIKSCSISWPNHPSYLAPVKEPTQRQQKPATQAQTKNPLKSRLASRSPASPVAPPQSPRVAAACRRVYSPPPRRRSFPDPVAVRIRPPPAPTLPFRSRLLSVPGPLRGGDLGLRGEGVLEASAAMEEADDDIPTFKVPFTDAGEEQFRELLREKLRGYKRGTPDSLVVRFPSVTPDSLASGLSG